MERTYFSEYLKQNHAVNTYQSWLKRHSLHWRVKKKCIYNTFAIYKKLLYKGIQKLL